MKTATTPTPAVRRARPAPPGQEISPVLIDEFLAWLTASGRAPHTINIYRLYLNRLLDWLPEDKTIRLGTITEWRQVLLQSMAAQTAEIHVNAANSYLEYCVRRDLQAPLVKIEAELQPELTRSEYLRLLSAARLVGQERTYFIIKTFGTLGLSASELKELTAEAVQQGIVRQANGKSVYIPQCFQKELLGYAEKIGVAAGPIFVTAGDKPVNRSNIWRAIASLSRDARVDEAKCNPRCIRRMCQQTKDGIHRNVALLEDQMYDRLLEQEQNTVGWAE